MNAGTKVLLAVIMAAIIIGGTAGYLWYEGPGDDDDSDNDEKTNGGGGSGNGTGDDPGDGGDGGGGNGDAPPDPSDITGYSDVNSYLDLSEEQLAYLAEHDFAFVTDAPKQYETFDEAYNDMHEREIPVLITSDSILHTYHIFFDDTLRKIEEEYLFGDAVNLSWAMYESSLERYESTSDPFLKEPALRNVGYFAVALKCFNENVTVPGAIAEKVEWELENITAHGGFAISPLFNDDEILNSSLESAMYNPDAVIEDYSQYKPRGHYTRSELLKKYFKGIMWYGRIPFLLRNESLTVGAIMMVEDLQTASHNGKATDHWDRIYDVTEKFVGESDDLSHKDYGGVIQTVFGDEAADDELKDHDLLEEFRIKASKLKKPLILGGYARILFYNGTDESMENFTQSYRLMGQRYIPDSYIFTNMVATEKNLMGYTGGSEWPLTCVRSGAGPIRGFPRGLDFMAVLGNEAAKEVIVQEGDDQFGGYYDARNELESEFNNLTYDNWTKNMYMGWLYSLDSLNDPVEGEEYPGFMTDEDWEYVKLNTNLASWAELRHDTILYAKQSYTAGADGGPAEPPSDEGYVEPVVELWERLTALTEDTKLLLSNEGVLSEARSDDLDSFIDVLTRLKEISEKELNGEELSGSDYGYIRNFGGRLEDLTGSASSDGKDTTMIADVHTDVNSEECLEEGVGYIQYVMVQVQTANGTWAAMAGPVFSYYEFRQPMADRLTDEEWKTLLDSSEAPEQQLWV